MTTVPLKRLPAGQGANYRIIYPGEHGLPPVRRGKKAGKRPEKSPQAKLRALSLAGQWAKLQPAAKSQLQAAWMLEACFPLGPWVTSNDTFWPSLSVLKPFIWIAEK
jgi:hypothetical protein